MAITTISSPPSGTGQYLSGSFPFKIVVETDQTGPTVTQHKFVAVVTNAGSVIASKYTIISIGANQGQFDFKQLFQSAFKLSPYYVGTTTPVTAASPINRTDGPVALDITIQLKEQYYLSGVFTENDGDLLTFDVVRGYTEAADKLAYTLNYYDLTGLPRLMTYSGRSKQGYVQKTDDPGWPTVAAQPWLRFELVTDGGGGAVISSSVLDRSLDEHLRSVFISLLLPGYTDQADFTYLEILTYTGIDAGSTTNLQQTVRFEKTVELCEDEEMLIMFQDRFFQWSFMSFAKKHRVTVGTSSQGAEAPEEGAAPGRYRYNVRASEVLALNTDWMTDEQNLILKDLLSTEQCYLVDPDGTLEHVVPVQNSLGIMTSRNDGMFQYGMQFRKSVDNFTA